MDRKETTPPIKKRQTFPLRLTKFEVLHLRDVMSVLISPEMKETVSQRLAASQDRVLVEARLWQKLVVACEAAGLPLGDDAPDFIVAASGPPPVGIFELAHDPTQVGQEPAETIDVFGGAKEGK